VVNIFLKVVLFSLLHKIDQEFRDDSESVGGCAGGSAGGCNDGGAGGVGVGSCASEGGDNGGPGGGAGGGVAMTV
jgi:hypothetical protein